MALISASLEGRKEVNNSWLSKKYAWKRNSISISLAHLEKLGILKQNGRYYSYISDLSWVEHLNERSIDYGRQAYTQRQKWIEKLKNDEVAERLEIINNPPYSKKEHYIKLLDQLLTDTAEHYDDYVKISDLAKGMRATIVLELDKFEKRLEQRRKYMITERIVANGPVDPSYDFKWDFVEYFRNDGISSVPTKVELMMYYKAFGPKYNIDCDASYRAMYIYKNAFEHLQDSDIVPQKRYNKNKEKYSLRNTEAMYIGDSMTSAWIPFKNYLITYHKELFDVWRERLVVPNDKRRGNSNLEKWANYIVPLIEDKKLLIPEYVSEFLHHYSTYGNMIAVSEGFNKARGHDYAEFDRWDLSLSCIYKWYMDNEQFEFDFPHKTKDEALDALLKGDLVAIQHCRDWLMVFGDFKSFIDQNILQDFVEIKTDGTYVPIMFFEGHSFENPFPTQEEYPQYFSRMTDLIKKRGKRISDKLNKENTITN